MGRMGKPKLAVHHPPILPILPIQKPLLPNRLLARFATQWSR
jgi:hypothetical protein